MREEIRNLELIRKDKERRERNLTNLADWSDPKDTNERFLQRRIEERNALIQKLTDGKRLCPICDTFILESNRWVFPKLKGYPELLCRACFAKRALGSEDAETEDSEEYNDNDKDSDSDRQSGILLFQNPKFGEIEVTIEDNRKSLDSRNRISVVKYFSLEQALYAAKARRKHSAGIFANKETLKFKMHTVPETINYLLDNYKDEGVTMKFFIDFLKTGRRTAYKIREGDGHPLELKTALELTITLQRMCVVERFKDFKLYWNLCDFSFDLKSLCRIPSFKTLFYMLNRPIKYPKLVNESI